ncbi:ACP S-malonyltransferase [Streptomyces sp. HSW2009]|uniref:ACP S-malonyltransferase n=1 Tax=Streptomyces sp. HSW2009 TaxID=3142890 RepID=UPI0032EDCB99
MVTAREDTPEDVRGDARADTAGAGAAGAAVGRAVDLTTGPPERPRTGARAAVDITGERLAALFPGQGVQRAGLGQQWREAPDWDKVTTAVSEASGHDVAELLLETDTEELTRTDLAQITVYTASLLSWAEFRRAHPTAEVAAFAGHSLGEYTALVAAGALTGADGARLGGARGRAMAEAARHTPGGMAAVMGAPPAEVTDLIERVRAAGGHLWIANLNSPLQTVVAGDREAIETGGTLARDAGWRYNVLPVAAAFHTPHMAPAAQALTGALTTVTFAPTHHPVVANADARPHQDGPAWPALCAHQLTSPVRWQATLHTLVHDLACTHLIDLGPARTLAGLARRTLPEIPATAVQTIAPARAGAGV